VPTIRIQRDMGRPPVAGSLLQYYAPDHHRD
jgi:hypothetical protein